MTMELDLGLAVRKRLSARSWLTRFGNRLQEFVGVE